MTLEPRLHPHRRRPHFPGPSWCQVPSGQRCQEPGSSERTVTPVPPSGTKALADPTPIIRKALLAPQSPGPRAAWQHGLVQSCRTWPSPKSDSHFCLLSRDQPSPPPYLDTGPAPSKAGSPTSSTGTNPGQPRVWPSTSREAAATLTPASSLPHQPLPDMATAPGLGEIAPSPRN